jgi:hypothetical protein
MSREHCHGCIPSRIMSPWLSSSFGAARMTPTQIDDAVFAVSQPSWRKVAMIIITAAERLGQELPEGDSGHQMIARRIEVLVRDGRLAAQGDISRWRHSEVRLP